MKTAVSLPSSLIRQVNGAFQKRSSSWRNLKTPAFSFTLNGKHFESKAFWKRYGSCDFDPPTETQEWWRVSLKRVPCEVYFVGIEDAPLPRTASRISARNAAENGFRHGVQSSLYFTICCRNCPHGNNAKNIFSLFSALKVTSEEG